MLYQDIQTFPQKQQENKHFSCCRHNSHPEYEITLENFSKTFNKFLAFIYDGILRYPNCYYSRLWISKKIGCCETYVSELTTIAINLGLIAVRHRRLQKKTNIWGLGAVITNQEYWKCFGPMLRKKFPVLNQCLITKIWKVFESFSKASKEYIASFNNLVKSSVNLKSRHVDNKLLIKDILSNIFEGKSSTKDPTSYNEMLRKQNIARVEGRAWKMGL